MAKTGQKQYTRTKKRSNKAPSFNLNPLDCFFLAFDVIITVYVLFFYHENPVFYTIVSVLALNGGVIGTIFNIKGYRVYFVFAFVEAFACFYTSWTNHFIGNAMINLLFYAPATLVGFHTWGKHTNKNNEVIARKFTPPQLLLTTVIFIFTTVVLDIILSALGGSFTFLDSASSVLAIYATILSVLRFREQWLFWFLTDILQVIMWTTTNDPAVLALRIFFPISSVYGYINWLKLIKKTKSNKTTKV